LEEPSASITLSILACGDAMQTKGEPLELQFDVSDRVYRGTGTVPAMTLATQRKGHTAAPFCAVLSAVYISR
jgi:hypothetical protein